MNNWISKYKNRLGLGVFIVTTAGMLYLFVCGARSRFIGSQLALSLRVARDGPGQVERYVVMLTNRGPANLEIGLITNLYLGKFFFVSSNEVVEVYGRRRYESMLSGGSFVPVFFELEARTGRAWEGIVSELVPMRRVAHSNAVVQSIGTMRASLDVLVRQEVDEPVMVELSSAAFPVSNLSITNGVKIP